MQRLLRRWFKKIGTEPLLLARSPGPGPSRFLVARFRDSHAAGSLERGQYRDLAYRLYLPSGSSQRDSLPLIVMLHGCKQDALSFAEGTGMNALAEEHRCAVLYPEQSVRSNPLRCWNWFESAALAGHGEAALLVRLIDQVANRRPIDARRVYAVGISAGGSMACLLSARFSRLFAACATHSGLMYGAASSTAQALTAMRSGPSVAAVERARLLMQAGESASTVPTLVIHGDRDTTVNPVNADHIIEQLQTRAEFIDPICGALTRCDKQRIESEGRRYEQQDYTRRGRVELRKILVEGLGHAWSGGDARHEFNDAEGPNAGRLILNFVTQYRRDIDLVDTARAIG